MTASRGSSGPGTPAPAVADTPGAGAARDRRSVEAALRESQERLELALDAAGQAPWEIDLISGAVIASPRLHDIFGISPGRTLQTRDDWREAVVQEDRTAIVDAIERAVTGEGSYIAEYRVRRQTDGALRWVSSVGVVRRDACGRAHRLIGVATDITERKAADEALKRSQAELQRERAFLRTVIDSDANVVMVKDAHGRILLANDAAARFHGISVIDLESRYDTDLPSVTPELRRIDQEVIRTRKESVTEAEVLGADGQRHAFVVVTTPMICDDGRSAALLMSAADVTWRKRADTALRESQEKYSAIYHRAPFAIALTSAPERRIVSVNDAFIALFEFGREQVIGRSPGELDIADPESLTAIGERLARDGSVRNFEVVRTVRSGARRVMSINIEPVTIGGEAFWLTTFDDITDRKEAEKKLQEADRRKNEFIAVLSHELRNPLAPMKYALPLLERESLGDGGTRAVRVIGRQLDHLARLVDDLLDVSRITRDKIELRRDRVTLGSIVSAAMEAASPAIAAARHTATLKVSPDAVWLNADPARLTQVVTNLLNNSAKFTPSGGQICVAAGREGGQAVIRVRDTGVGIPSDALPTVFDMFRQVHHTGTQGGLGIGLALARRLVEMHQGTIEASSAGEGQGSEFVVRLPLADAPGITAGGEVARDFSGNRRLKVLIVDDNVDLVEMLAMVVGGLGHRVQTSLDGESAVSTALTYRPDVVVLDVGLPVMNGLDVARELRRHDETAHARLIALTGWGQPEDREKTADAGFDYHLTKPADPRRLEQLLGQVAAELIH